MRDADANGSGADGRDGTDGFDRSDDRDEIDDRDGSDDRSGSDGSGEGGSGASRADGDAERDAGVTVKQTRPCPYCGSSMVHRHCEYVCPEHGVVFDCSDTFYG